MSESRPRVAEFFAGVGLVRLGLEAAGMHVVWANDIEPAKQEMYQAHFGMNDSHEFRLDDIGHVEGSELPDVDVAWASFPCTDLSLAGWRRGLDGSESATFFHFTRLLRELGGRKPRVVALENVVGFATSRGGDDLRTAIKELNELGYSADVFTLDARRFVPQSRPRLFIVGTLDQMGLGADDVILRPDWLRFVFEDPELQTHVAPLPSPPALLSEGFTRIADRLSPGDEAWWDEGRTARFLDSLSDVQAERVDKLRKGRSVAYRTAYRRTRGGKPVWEVRADDVSGCLRTARGGSSKQAVVRAGRGRVMVRWMTPFEYAKLMGAGNYRLHGIRPLQAMFGFGDAVCVPVVSWVAEHYLVPLVAGDLAERDEERAS